MTCPICKLPTLCWWAPDGRGHAWWRCVSPECGVTTIGPRVAKPETERRAA